MGNKPVSQLQAVVSRIEAHLKQIDKIALGSLYKLRTQIDEALMSDNLFGTFRETVPVRGRILDILNQEIQKREIVLAQIGLPDGVHHNRGRAVIRDPGSMKRKVQ